MLFHADLGSRDQAAGYAEQPRLPITLPAPIDRNSFEAEIDGGEIPVEIIDQQIGRRPTGLLARSIAASERATSASMAA